MYKAKYNEDYCILIKREGRTRQKGVRVSLIVEFASKNTYDTEMNTKRTMLNCGTSIVQTVSAQQVYRNFCTMKPTGTCIRYGSETPTMVKTVLYIGCTKTTVPCSPYMHTIR